ncbi:signal peptidase I [Caproiciproducens sp.]
MDHENSVSRQETLTEKKRNFIINSYEWVEALISSLIAVIVVFMFLFRVVNVSGPSMLPTLRSNDRVILSSFFYKPHQGDVIVITHTTMLKEPIIKRVVALENQVVDIDFETGVVSVDGVALDESAYIENGITTQPSDFHYPLQVPPGHVFVLGDNRSVSNDSRFVDVGMVDERYILGKAEMIVFPFNRLGTIK